MEQVPKRNLVRDRVDDVVNRNISDISKEIKVRASHSKAGTRTYWKSSPSLYKERRRWYTSPESRRCGIIQMLCASV